MIGKLFMQPKFQWCCPVFQGHYEKVGTGTGFGIVISLNSLGEPMIRLHHQSVELYGREQFVAPPGTKVALSSEVGILYCPWCGKNLYPFYGKFASQLSRPDLESVYITNHREPGPAENPPR